MKNPPAGRSRRCEAADFRAHLSRNLRRVIDPAPDQRLNILGQGVPLLELRAVSALAYQAGQFLVGDAFGFAPEGGRVQFRATNASSYLFQASTNREHWTTIATNVGLNDLVIWIDRDVTNYPHRFYRNFTVP